MPIQFPISGNDHHPPLKPLPHANPVSYQFDPEGVMPPPMKWMLNVLQGDALAFYSLGYWYARAHNLGL